MITINMTDGEQIKVLPDTLLIGLNNSPRDISSKNAQEFYLKQEYIGNLQGDYDRKGSPLATGDERLGIAGFLLSHDLFALSEDYGATMYFTSAIKSISVG